MESTTKVLLTGGSGLVGRNFLETASKHPDIDVYAPSHKDMDLGNYKQTLQAISSYSPDFIIHAAGRVGGIHANIKYPTEFLIENLDMGRNLLLAAHEANVSKVINLGSSCMYPKDYPGKLTEDLILSDRLEETNEGYALAKITIMKLACYISKQFIHRQYKTFIPCNLFGVWDHFTPDRSHMVAAAIAKIDHAIRSKSKEVQIWGTGNDRREFMYAENLAIFLVAAIKNFQSLPPVMNVGINTDYSVNDYYQTIARLMKYEGTFVHDSTKPSGMKQKLMDSGKLLDWGFQPSISLEEGLKRTIDFYRNHGNGENIQ